MLLPASVNLGRRLLTHNATKTLMTGSGIHLLRNSRCRAIAKAVVRSIQEGTAFHHLPWDLNFWTLWIVALLTAAARRPSAAVGGCATRNEPVARPLPDIAGHVI